MARHPMQPLAVDEHGVLRFKANAIVQFLAKDRLNELATMDFSRKDWTQLAQLIGYSHSGFGELPYVDDETYDAAARMHDDGMTQDQAVADSLRKQIDAIKAGLRDAAVAAFKLHADDLEDR